jgi:hypothetical protein
MINISFFLFMLKMSRLLLPFFLILSSVGIFSVMGDTTSLLLTGTHGDTHIVWVYSTGWNAWKLSFDDTPPGYSWAQIVGFGTTEVSLTGIYWIETVWWASFSDSVVTLVPPVTGANVRDPWYLSWYAWSPNAGWIALNHWESYASGVAFIPDTKKLVWYGYSPTIGWVPFGTYGGTGVLVDIKEWFVGKIDVIGTIGGSKTFNVLYEVGWSFNSASMTAFSNVVRKNISIIMRNATAKINTNMNGVWAQSFNKSMIFRTENNPTSEFVTYSRVALTFDNDLSRSLIVIGADIYIDTDVITPSLLLQSRAIIALKNEKWEWGNIWIKGSVKKIESVLFSEKSILSGAEFTTGSLSPYYVTKKSVFVDIPRNQLYIKWSVWGYNTIGWSSKDGGAVCPYLSDSSILCNYDNSIKYDWNYFRIYNGTPARRAYKDSTKDDYSVIVEYDSRTIQDPPPGLETLN